MKNERHKPDNPTETRTIQSRTQTAAQNPELGNSDRTGYRNPESLSTAAAKMPRRSGSPKGSGEVLERDRGSKSPVSFQPPPRGANKIYTYDVVFSPGEARKKIHSQTPLPLRSPKLYPALSPRRRRMLPQPLANDLLRERIAHIGKQSDLHKRNPSPSPYKSFAELFQKRPSPPVPLVSPRLLL